jgi:hypothetical protein
MRRPKSTAAFEKWMQNFGSATGADYQSFLTVQGFSSRGTSGRIRGVTTGRIHHLFSLLEVRCFRLIDWEEDTADIREQWGLDPGRTQAIAQTLGVRHPRDSRTGAPYIMTTDFVVTRRGEFGCFDEAIAVKPKEKLKNSRVQEKLKIEELYWAERGIAWQVRTEDDIDPVRAANVAWITSSPDPPTYKLSASIDVQTFLGELASSIASAPHIPLGLICRAADERTGLPPGLSLALVRQSLASRRWRCDLSKRIHPQDTLRTLQA